MMISSFLKTRAWRWGVAGAALVLVLVAVSVVVMARTQRGAGDITDQLTFVVKRGPLTISVTEAGTIKAREQEILKCEVEGKTTVIRLVPEGKLVKKGDLLVELDASELEDEKVDQMIQVQNAEALWVGAREDLEVTKSQAQSDIAEAELNFQFAQEDVKQYLKGEYPKELKEVESKITLAEEELKRATEKLKWSETLFKEKYISRIELETDQLTKNRAELERELAVASRDLLKNFTYHRNLTQLNSDVDQTRMALERERRKGQADIVQAEANRTAKKLVLDRQNDKLGKIEKQITKTKIYAPLDGMAIYATSAKGSWRGSQEPLDEGQEVREREELIYLPTADAKIAEVKLHESNLDKVEEGLPVRITVDALPGKAFRGKVATIAPLPDPMMMWLNPDLKIYATQIYLMGDCEGMRTGMTCQATIIVERYPDAVYVPVQAVLRVGRVPTVYVLKDDNEVEPRTVEIGLDNNSMVRIISGLEPGEKVLLSPPLALGTAPPVSGAQKKPEASKQPGERKKPAKPPKGGAKAGSSKPPEKRGGRK